MIELWSYNVITIIFFIVFFYFKEYKTPMQLAYIPIIGTFIIQIYYYYYLEGKSYRVFSKETLEEFICFSSIILLQIIILIVISNGISKRIKFSNRKCTKILSIYFDIILYSMIIYTVFYLKKFPLIQAILYKNITRLDTSGDIKYYIIASSMIYFIIPSFSFFSGKKRYFIFSIIFGILSLHKGILFFDFMFYWCFVMNKKVNKKFIIGLIFGGTIYLISKNRFYFNFENLKYFLESSIRRIFITQGSGFIVRLELLNLGFDFTGKNIKQEIFKYIYKIEGGSAPTYFLGTLIIQAGYKLGFLIHFIVLMFLFIFSKIIMNGKKLNNFNFWCWELFSIYYIILNSDINVTNIFRIIAIILNLLMIRICSIYDMKNKSLKRGYYG